MSSLIILFMFFIIKFYNLIFVFNLKFLKKKNFFEDFLLWIVKYFSKYKIYNSNVILFVIMMCVYLKLFFLIVLIKSVFGLLGEILFNFIICLYCINNAVVQNNSLFVYSHEKIFVFLFYFIFFNSFGVAFYWIITFVKKFSVNNKNIFVYNPYVEKIDFILSVFLSRITGFFYALVGNFMQGYKYWIKSFYDPSVNHEKFLIECGEASTFNFNDKEKKSFIERTFIIWIVFGIFVKLLLIFS